MCADHFICSFLGLTWHPILAGPSQRKRGALLRRNIAFTLDSPPAHCVTRRIRKITATNCRRPVRLPLSQIGNAGVASLSQIKEWRPGREHGTHLE
jgi:hypothetical protein